MKNPTKKQEETLREFLHSAVVPLIEDVLVKKLGQAMSYAKEQLAPPSKPDVNQELVEALSMLTSYTEACEGMLNASPAGQVIAARELLAKHKEQV